MAAFTRKFGLHGVSFRLSDAQGTPVAIYPSCKALLAKNEGKAIPFHLEVRVGSAMYMEKMPFMKCVDNEKKTMLLRCSEARKPV